MKFFIIVLLLLSSTASFAHDSKVISAVKKNPKVAAYLKEAKLASSTISFHQMPLTSICGFAGCELKELVNIKVTSTQSSASTKSMLAVVSYMELNEKSPIKVSIATLSY